MRAERKRVMEQCVAQEKELLQQDRTLLAMTLHECKNPLIGMAASLQQAHEATSQDVSAVLPLLEQANTCLAQAMGCLDDITSMCA